MPNSQLIRNYIFLQMISILIVEDDKNAGILLSENLSNEGFKSKLSKNGIEGLKLFKESVFDLCILDIMLPGMDGINLARNIRNIDKNIPIIFLSARTLDMDKIEGFKAGCDDYITKPYNIRELILRVYAIMRRKQDKYKTAPDKWSFGKFRFVFSERKLSIDDKSRILSTKEADILKIFLKKGNESISRSYILENVWGTNDFYTSQGLDVYLSKLRKYLAEDSDINIQNIHGFGYKLIVKPS